MPAVSVGGTTVAILDGEQCARIFRVLDTAVLQQRRNSLDVHPSVYQALDAIQQAGRAYINSSGQTPAFEQPAQLDGSYRTVSEAAELLNLSTKTIYRRIDAGKLTAIKKGGAWLIRLSTS